MKIDPYTISVLENFASINPAVWINEGNILETVSPSKSVIARATVETTFPKSFGLYRVAQLINVLSMYSDADVTFENTYLTVSSGMRSTKLSYGDPKLCEPCQVPAGYKFPSSNIKASISGVVIKDLSKAARTLSVEDYTLQGDGERLLAVATSNSKPGSNFHTVQLGHTTNTFKAIMKHSNVTLLPEDYEVEIIAGDLPSIKFASSRVQYIVALDESSEF